MDRFIDYFPVRCTSIISHLKSNMDRFIAEEPTTEPVTVEHLKSNMDRFIAVGQNDK